MEDKLFDLMTTMYTEITNKLDSMDKKLEGKADKSDIARMEKKQDTDSKVLFDGYKQTYDKLQMLETKIDGLSQTIEKQDVELKVLKGGK